MRFSVQVQDEPKMFFHSFPAAEKATGLNRQTIREVLERGNKVYHRKVDHKLSFPWKRSKQSWVFLQRDF